VNFIHGVWLLRDPLAETRAASDMPRPPGRGPSIAAGFPSAIVLAP